MNSVVSMLAKVRLSATRFFLLLGLAVGVCLLALLQVVQPSETARGLADTESYAVYYGVGQADALQSYDLAIVQPNTFTRSELKRLQDGGTQVVAYLSVGEVEPNRPWFSDGRVPQEWLLGYNEAWGSYHVDVRQEGWQTLLVDVAGTYLKAGFDGIFLDTVDTALLYPNTEFATLSIIQKLRNAYPRTLLVQNRGLAIIEASHKYVDALMVESISTRYDFKEKRYARADPSFEGTQIAQLMQATDLKVLALEYAPLDNPAMAWNAIQTAKAYGFIPAVSTINLTELPDYGLDNIQPDPRITDFSLQGSADKPRLEVLIENVGLGDATELEVALFEDGKKVSATSYAELKTGEKVLWDFAWDARAQNLEVTVSASEDARTDNNSRSLSADVAQEPVLPSAAQRRRPETNGPFLSAASLEDPLVINGDLSDWRKADCVALGKAEQINFAQADTWEGPQDLSGTVCFYWDEDNLYLSADVTDDRLEQRFSGTDLWHGDHLELWIDTQLQLDFDSQRESEDDFQFGFSPGNFENVPPDFYLWTPSAPRERYDSRVEYAAVKSETGYRLEVRLPASVLAGLKLEPEHAVGLTVALSDTDTPGSPEQETMLATAPELRWGVPSTFNTLVFSPEALAGN